VDVLNSVLVSRNLPEVGEEIPEPLEEKPVWSALDHTMYSNWERDFLSVNSELSRDQVRKLWESEYGTQVPSQVLI